MALGIPVVVLTTVVGTSVRATPQESLNPGIRITWGRPYRPLLLSSRACTHGSVWVSRSRRTGQPGRAGPRSAGRSLRCWRSIRRMSSPTAIQRSINRLRKRIDEVAAESRRWAITIGPAPCPRPRVRSQTRATDPREPKAGPQPVRDCGIGHDASRHDGRPADVINVLHLG
jgi:hypothetical protein